MTYPCGTQQYKGKHLYKVFFIFTNIFRNLKKSARNIVNFPAKPVFLNVSNRP